MNELIENFPLTVHLVGKHPSDFIPFKKIFQHKNKVSFQFIPLAQLSNIDQYRANNLPDVIFLDLSSSNKNGLSIFLTLHNVISEVPIVVLGNSNDDSLAVQLLSEGAQDYLSKDHLDIATLNRSISFALARQNSIKQLRFFSLMDELTGLYNRRGFFALAEHQLELANKSRQSLLLAFVDLNGLKTINDVLGHQRGDLALAETAHILKETFKKTNILARLGGDEFVALMVCDSENNAETLKQQFYKTLEEHNSYGRRSFKLSASIGIAVSNPHSPVSIDQLLEKADHLMYEQKSFMRRPYMVYQLRFLSSVPIAVWLKRTAALLEVLIPPGAWDNPNSSADYRIKKIKGALANGLQTFVIRRSLCGTDMDCDLGCTPAPENKNPDRFGACVILGHARQYLVHDVKNLKEMAERLSASVLKECPGASPVYPKIQIALQDTLAAHLYENTQCLRAPICRNSKLMDLQPDL